MPRFSYKALLSDGGQTEGSIDASGRAEALRLLEGKGLRPIRLAETGADIAAAKKTDSAADSQGFLAARRRRVPASALENFTRQLASLLAAGVPLSRSLAIVTREAGNAAASARWNDVRERVIDGSSLADAMTQHPDTFPRVYVAMVQSGEAGGFLDLVLRQIADFQRREKDLRGRVSSALIYPAVLLFLAVAVVIFLLVFFIPRFQAIFSDFGAALPLITRFVVGSSELAARYGPLAFLLLVAAGVAARQWLHTDAGRRQWERFVLRLPILGDLIARFAMARFCRMLGTLLGAGVPLINALRVARESLGNQTLVDAVGEASERVRQGERLSTGLAECGALFPGSVVEMIAVAEESSRLDTELVRLAEEAEGDLDRRLRMAVALAEPAMLFIMAAFIGTIVVGMVLPIFTIQDYIK